MKVLARNCAMRQIWPLLGFSARSSNRAQATAVARMAAMHDGLDGPEQQAVPLSDPGLMERIRHAEAKR
ncbi:hypothetical protein KHT87_22805, partial [Alkalihalobacillus clausii]|uniref:hypothetical protein n=1 Tax=Shouchella clausii TaxID=79880 RepID=UPI001C0E1A65